MYDQTEGTGVFFFFDITNISNKVIRKVPKSQGEYLVFVINIGHIQKHKVRSQQSKKTQGKTQKCIDFWCISKFHLVLFF
jgi:hypothetical protein